MKHVAKEIAGTVAFAMRGRWKTQLQPRGATSSRVVDVALGLPDE